MHKHAITDVTLRTMVGIRLEIGVGISEIRRLIDKFASEHQKQREGTVGFLVVEDIPQDLRPEFLSELASLPRQPGYPQASDGAARSPVTAADTGALRIGA